MTLTLVPHLVYALPRSESNLFWRLFANENALKRKKKKKAFFITLAVDNLGVDAERLLPSMRRYKKDAHHHGVAAVAACIVLAWLQSRANERRQSALHESRRGGRPADSRRVTHRRFPSHHLTGLDDESGGSSTFFDPSNNQGGSSGHDLPSSGRHDRTPKPPTSLAPPPHTTSPSLIIFMRPHTFGAKGDHFDRTFVPLVIRAVLHFNPTAQVYMLHNDPAFSLPGQPRLHGLLMKDYETPAIRQFKASYVHLSTNAAPFEMSSTLAYFFVASLMDALKLDKVVVVETDVLVFCDLWATLAAHWDLHAVDAVLTKRRVMAASYVTRTYLETYVNVALDFYRDGAILAKLREATSKSLSRGGVSDMTVNAWLAKPGFASRNGANHTVVIDELSQLIEMDGTPGAPPGAPQTGAPPTRLAYFDSNIRTANYSFGRFAMEQADNLGPVKELHAVGPNSLPHGHLDGQPVTLWALHFQGGTKELIPSVFQRFVAGREQSLNPSRLRYYVHGHEDQASRTAATAPARSAAALGVATAEPVAGRGRANPDGLRAKGRLLMLNASICAAGLVAITSEIERQIGPDSPVARQGALPAYVADACAVAPITSAAYVVGDVGSCFSKSVFAKARPCGCNTTTLLNLNRAHHFGFGAVSKERRRND
jgi:hypothetical protein